MKNRVLGVILILVLFASCKKLKVEYFDLTTDCKPKGMDWADTLRQPENGIHYVAVDTATCRLIVKFDEKKTSIGWINAYLIRNNLEFIPKEIIEDSILVSDSIEVEEIEVLSIEIPKPEIVEQELIEEVIDEQEDIILPLDEVIIIESQDSIEKTIEDTL